MVATASHVGSLGFPCLTVVKLTVPAKGKKAHDKRATIREREAKKEVARAMKHYKR